MLLTLTHQKLIFFPLFPCLNYSLSNGSFCLSLFPIITTLSFFLSLLHIFIMRFLCNTHSSISSVSNKQLKLPNQLTCFSYADLQTSTYGFSPRALLGKGSHGAVYRAVLHHTVAVKKPNSSVADTANNELDILSKLRSRRIVNLIGYAVDSTSKLLLVVEYMPNGSLYDLLHKNPDAPGLSTRVRLALQVAKAVRTLHKCNPPVMHRDIKSSNVLIDERGNARLSDFGLAIKGHVEDARVKCTPPAGTLGYLDPCYLAPGDLSTKSDVFSFGILLLEILSGRKAIDVEFSPPSVVDWALPLIKSDNYQGILDRRIKGRLDQTVVRELVLVAARCVRSKAEKRPPVVEIVDCLNKVYTRVKRVNLGGGIHVWNNIRGRVRNKNRSQPLDDVDAGSDWDESRVVVMTPRHGSKKPLSDRNSRVSNVEVEENNNGDQVIFTRGSHPKVGCRLKSKSIGSFREIPKVGPESGEMVLVKRRGQVTVKIASLGKSRSMSVIYSGKNNNNNNNDNNNAEIKEVEVFPLLVNYQN